MAKRLFKVTILFCFILACFVIPCYAASLNGIDFSNQPFSNTEFPWCSYNNANKYVHALSTPEQLYCFVTQSNYIVVCSDSSFTAMMVDNSTRTGQGSGRLTLDGSLFIYYMQVTNGIDISSVNTNLFVPLYNDVLSGLSDVYDVINAPAYSKNPNVDEFIANTLISMGIRYSQYSDALNIASTAWDYIIDENNWYIGSGDRNDKDIVWNIDTAVSYANAQSNNYLDWYNGYKVNKDLTVAFTKFISDNYTASSLGQGTLAGYNVYYDSSYSYSAGGYGFGGSPSAYSFYPASTITYFNGAYLHEDNVIDQDEFVYSPADVRKFLGYPSSSGLIEPPDSSFGTGVITDGNGDTVYNIDLDWPSFDWLAAAIQSVLDFLDRLITTIADFLTQILDAILSLFSDAFESLTEFGEGIIEWLYAIVAGFSTIGGNYIPSSLWAVILPFILINIGVGLIIFVMRSH